MLRRGRVVVRRRFRVEIDVRCVKRERAENGRRRERF